MTQVAAGVSEADLAGLSEEEIAALRDTDDDAEGLAEVAGDDNDDEDTAGDDKAKAGVKTDGEDADDTVDAAAGADKSAKSKADDDAADDKPKGDNAAAQAVADDAALAPVMPRYHVEPVADYAARIAAINDETAQLAASFRAGDIEVDEFQAKQAEIQGQRDALLAQKIKADVSVEYNAQAAQNEWALQCAYFMKEVKRADGIDYAKDTVTVAGKAVPLRTELDKMVKALANDPANANQNGEWFLREADAIVRARYGVVRKSAKADDRPPAKPPVRKPDLRAVPKTLGSVPAAAGGDASDDSESGEFAHLDKLNGLDLENAVARMTPEQQKRYAEA